jgi:hypothetical protein
MSHLLLKAKVRVAIVCGPGMPTKEFIFQGFTARRHAEAVLDLFAVPDIEAVIVSVAFVSEAGAHAIAEKLDQNAERSTIFAGIRNDITSHQGLAKLINTKATLYTVDTGSRYILFHPKVFLVCGKNLARMVIGSANLTLGGLNNNIEAGVVLEFDLTNIDDKAFIDGILAQFAALPKDYPEHIVSVTKSSALDDMLSDGLLTDEAVPLPPKPSTAAKPGAKHGAVTRIKLKTAHVSGKPHKGAEAPKPPKVVKSAAVAATGVEYDLVWQSKALARRDLTIPKAAGTHATGSVNLDKGLLPADVDHRHYFRDDVFPALTWAKATPTTEESYAKFHLVLQGVSYGEFDLRIGHTVGTGSEAYKQNNAMTRLSWGPMKAHIAQPEFIGMTLSLYRDKADPTRFMLEID